MHDALVAVVIAVLAMVLASPWVDVADRARAGRARRGDPRGG